MQDTKLFILYYHKSPANKYYVGITSKKSVIQRWHLDGSGYRTQIKFWRAIQKYGWDNFEHVVVKTDLTEADAYAAEQFFIKLYDSKTNGYNSDDGGKGSIGHSMSNESRQKISNAKKGKYTDAQKQGAISAAKKHTKNIYVYDINSKLLNTFFGYNEAAIYYSIPVSTIRNFCASKNVYKKHLIFLTKQNEDALSTIIANFKTLEIEKTKPTIGQYDVSGKYVNSFNSYKEAAAITGIPLGSISKVCSGFELVYKNFIFIKLNKETIEERLLKISQHTGRNYAEKAYEISQFSLTGDLLAKYDTYKAAAIATGISKKYIINVCTGKCHSCYGYIFKKQTIK